MWKTESKTWMKEHKNNQRPAGLQQPRLAVKADAFQDKKTRESKEGFAPEGKLRDISPVRVHDDHMGWASFGDTWVGPASVIHPNLQL